MPESSSSPYEVLGVHATASSIELRRAYRRALRLAHPDTGGSPERFQAVQWAWELIGEPSARSAYDARGHAAQHEMPRTSVWNATRPGGASGTVRTSNTPPQARSYGHPGGASRDHYVALVQEWVGLGDPVGDPYDPELIRRVPANVRHQLLRAFAQEATVREVLPLGPAFTIWSDVRAGGKAANGIIDHIVLTPWGVVAVRSANWESNVRLSGTEVRGDALDEHPVYVLTNDAKAFAYDVGIRVEAVLVVVPDEAVDEPVQVRRRRLHPSIALVGRSALARVLREGAPVVNRRIDRDDVDEAFELRSVLNDRIRFA